MNIDTETGFAPQSLDMLKQTGITIFGCGGIGSITSLLLVKMGFPNICLIDNGEVKVVNVSSQIYGYKHVGMRKADALVGIIDSLSPGTYIPKKYGVSKALRGDGVYGICYEAVDAADVLVEAPYATVIISTLSSATGRRIAWEEAKRLNETTKLFIDVRMGTEYGHLFTVNMSNPRLVARYASTLAPTSVPEPTLPCPTFVMAGLTANNIKRFVTGQEIPYRVSLDLANLFIEKVYEESIE